MTKPASVGKPISWYARRYVERFGFHLVPIEPKRKFPRSNDWGNSTLSTPDEAEKFYTDHPDWNMGVALGPSRMCSLDIDCYASFCVIMHEFGIDPESLKPFPTIQGARKGMRIEFRVPDGVSLPYQKLNWPSKNDPTGAKHKAAMSEANDAKLAGDTEREARIRAVAKRWAMYTVLELRSSTDGKQRQDVYPPSQHPDTGKPYVWLSQPKDEWPTPPAWLIAIWTDWGNFKPQLTAMCPWLPIEKQLPPKVAKQSTAIGGNVIQAFVDAHDLRSMLEHHGYKRIGTKRYLSPYSGTGLPGVVLLPDNERCYIHHASDPLCSDESGKPVNAFDLFAYYEHNGDIRNAVKAAASMLGLEYTKEDRVQHATSQAPNPESMPIEQGNRDYMSPLPWANDKGKPLNHLDNLRELCRRLGVVVRYNVIKKNQDIIIPGQSFTIDNEASASLAWLSSECSLFHYPTSKLDDFITVLADQNQYNPVAQWIESKPWDGVTRIQALCNTVTTHPEQSELKDTLITRWLTGAVAAAYLPHGISMKGILTFQGTQSLGKTPWFKALAPDFLDVIKDSFLLKPDDKDSVKRFCSYWLVELGELDATFKRSDISQLKAFVSSDRDELRLPYARRDSKLPRRTVAFASVNPKTFLNDPTGNTRFWTIACTHINWQHGIDMQQLWTEVLLGWRNGDSYYLTPEELNTLNESNTDFMAVEPVEERLLNRLDWDAPELQWRWEQASVVLVECGLDRPTKFDAATAGALIRSRNGDKSKRVNGKKMLLCPPLVMRA